MIMKFLLIAAIIATLMIPLNLQSFPIAFAQTSDKSFKGNEPPFIPPPESERIPKAPPSDAVSIKDSPPVGITDTEEEEEEEVETDKDKLPPLTAREIKELPFDTINDSELKDIKIISNETSSSDPIKSILEEIIKNDSIISNDNDIDSFNLSKIKNKFNDTQLEQIFIAQNMSRDSVSVEENNTNITPNTIADQDNDDNILSETDLPTLDILNLVNNTKVNSNVTETKEQPAITDELSTEGNVTETEGNVTETEGNVTETEGNVTETEEQPAITDELSTEGNVTETEEQPAITDELSTEGNVTETEEQPAITDELSTEGNVTGTGEQRNEEGSLQGGKSITVEEVPSKSTDFQVEEPTEGNVTIKGQLANNTLQDSSITTSSELQPLEEEATGTQDEDQQQQQPLEEEATGTQDEDQQQQQPLEEEATGTQDEDQQQQQPLEEEATGTQDEDQQQQQPLEEEATKQLPKDEKKIKVSEICNDELDNDHDGIIDEEHDCLSRTSDSTSTSEKIVPELATLDDDEKDEVKDEANIQTEKNSDEEQVTDDSQKSKNKNNKLIEEDRTSLESLDPEMQPSGVEILTTTEICNDEMDNDLDASIDEKDCISK